MKFSIFDLVNVIEALPNLPANSTGVITRIIPELTSYEVEFYIETNFPQPIIFLLHEDMLTTSEES